MSKDCETIFNFITWISYWNKFFLMALRAFLFVVSQLNLIKFSSEWKMRKRKKTWKLLKTFKVRISHIFSSSNIHRDTTARKILIIMTIQSSFWDEFTEHRNWIETRYKTGHRNDRNDRTDEIFNTHDDFAVLRQAWRGRKKQENLNLLLLLETSTGDLTNRLDSIIRIIATKKFNRADIGVKSTEDLFNFQSEDYNNFLTIETTFSRHLNDVVQCTKSSLHQYQENVMSYKVACTTRKWGKMCFDFESRNAEHMDEWRIFITFWKMTKKCETVDEIWENCVI